MKSPKARALIKPRFRPGAGGACEATLFRFTPMLIPGGQEPKSKAVAATHLDQAYEYVRRRYPDLQISHIDVGELIEMISASPLD